MKRCPTCRSTYTDDSLRFCLQDGSQLVHISAEEGSPEDDRTMRGHLSGRPDYGGEAPPTEMLDARMVSPTARTRTAAATEVIHSRATEVAGQRASGAHASPSPVLKTALIVVATLLVAGTGLGLTLWLRSSPASSTNNRNTVMAEGSPSKVADNTSSDPAKSDSQNASAVKSIRASASSTRPALAGNTYEPGNALDGRLMTAWVEGVGGAGIGEWLHCDFGREVTLNRISIAPGYFKSPQIWARNNRLAAATINFSDGTSRRFRFPDRMEEQILEVGAVKTSWVRIVIEEVYDGTDPDTAISQLAFE